MISFCLGLQQFQKQQGESLIVTFLPSFNRNCLVGIGIEPLIAGAVSKGRPSTVESEVKGW